MLNKNLIFAERGSHLFLQEISACFLEMLCFQLSTPCLKFIPNLPVLNCSILIPFFYAFLCPSPTVLCSASLTSCPQLPPAIAPLSALFCAQLVYPCAASSHCSFTAALLNASASYPLSLQCALNFGMFPCSIGFTFYLLSLAPQVSFLVLHFPKGFCELTPERGSGQGHLFSIWFASCCQLFITQYI